MDEIMQGTTPALTITISTDDFLLSNVTRLELYIGNGGTIKTYDAGDVTIDTTENSFRYVFTETETAAFSRHFPVEAQARFWFSDGSVVGIRKLSFDVADMMGVGD